MMDDEIRSIAVDYFKKEQSGKCPIQAGNAVLPAGSGLAVQDGCLVRIPVAELGTAVIQYLGAGGFPRQAWVRQLAWEQLDDHSKRALWSDGTVPHWQPPESGYVYQAGNFKPDEIDWDQCMGHIALTPEEAVFETIPWHILDSWQGEGLEVWHVLFYFAEVLRCQAQEAAERARAEAAAEAERIRLQQQAEWQAFHEAYGRGRSAVTYRNGAIPVAWQQNGQVETGEVGGYNIVAAGTDQDTGFGVYKRALTRTISRWYLTHKGTGLMLPDFGLPGRENALALAGMLYNMWDGWAEVKSADEIPGDVRQAAADIIKRYRQYMMAD